MLFPFRTSAIFRNRWVALMWAAGVCFMASEIVDSVAGIGGKAPSASHAAPAGSSDDPVAVALGNARPPTIANAPPPPTDIAR
ncbi:hypothetical protein [Sphingomonas profundi]|uniref:hypothetical protein n=1 Tax=Alterirhizorhabdus profundi TaxID=2681549 RepID=UPI0012E7506D|nr:hypothetical protein [Sphingomonas profundi]